LIHFLPLWTWQSACFSFAVTVVYKAVGLK
jgi:hypothetical protein